MNAGRHHRMRQLHLLFRVAAAGLLATAAPLPSAQSRLDSATSAELVAALSTTAPEPPAPMLTRSLGRATANAPDPATSLCVGPDNTPSSATPDGGTRNLYVTAAPKVDLNVRFGFDSAAITPDAEPMLAALATALTSPELRGHRFVVAGHTDRRGSNDYNKRLSCERALAVRAFLVKRYAIDSKRLVALGFGFDKLLDAETPENEVNRRVEIRRF
ncbi:Outer membrane protein OmpA [Massilia yuzhufengensis]|uniref:Outer membrane protein OmpA n=2 Tax=Massilia yuzhufengensis TaxID=1164594 RepID=A0A1I1EEF9_9BURK|nr:Outer membrane protein OmpA [Massilia yuzhufengensis]